MKITLYTLPGSHPGVAARLMLEHKGIDYRRVDLPPAVSRLVVRALGFSETRTPAMRLDGQRIQGSTQISRALDRLRPEPPLFPADPDKRAAVEAAERWGEDLLQPIPRTISWWAFKRDRSGIGGFLENARLGLPPGALVRTAGPIIWISGRLNGSSDANVRSQLAALPGALDRIDDWTAEGVLNGDELNAADFQIATSLRLLMCFDDLLPAFEARPAGELARRVAPDPDGRIPRIFPPEWIAALKPARA